MILCQRIVLAAVFAGLSAALMGHLAGCRKGGQANAGAVNPLVGVWSGAGVVYSAAGTEESRTSDFEFHFNADGACRIGKAKVWIKGTYEFSDDSRFRMTAGSVFSGEYTIVETGPKRIVFERDLGKGRKQRTELTR
jgi:hypothetical protein